MTRVLKHKKAIIVACSIFIVLFICYLIGQNIVLPSRMKAAGYVDINGNVPEYSIIENFNSFALGGQADADVLGGKTIGMVELNKDNCDLSEKWLGKSIFMTPGTSMAQRLYLAKKYNVVSFKYAMYPSITKSVSDGANIIIELYDDEDSEALLRKEYVVTPESDFENVELDISEFKGRELTLAISCDGGKNEDGDWVIIKNISISK